MDHILGSPPGPNGAWRGFFCSRAFVGLINLFCFTAGTTIRLSGQVITLAGSVTDRHTSGAIAGCLVTLVSSDGSFKDTVRTDGSGGWSYTFQQTSIAGSVTQPNDFVLGQNYPNPFNPSTRIPLRVPKQSRLRLSVYNILGQRLDALELELQPGTYAVEWRGKGSAGVYIYSAEINGKRYSRKMIQLDGGGSGGFGSFVPSSGTFPMKVNGITSVDLKISFQAFAYEPDSASIVLSSSSNVVTALESIHDRASVIDLHNDVVEKIVASQYTYDIGVRHSTNQTDLPRMRDGGLDAQMISIYVDPTSYDASQYYSKAIEFIDSVRSQVNRNSSQVGLTVTADSILALNATGKIAGVLLLEGGHCIQEDLEKLKVFYSKGVRVMTITWNNSTSWAVSAQDSRSATVGLSDFGKQVIRTMDSLGMVIDVSHVGPKTVQDILSIAGGPIIASHSGCKALCNHYRNLTDDQIRAIAERGGVVGVVFYPPFLTTSGTATIETVADHIDHIRNLVGVDYIALGSDFDGIERTPVGLADVSKFPDLTKVLLRRGYSREDVRKILGANFLRVLRTVCR